MSRDLTKRNLRSKLAMKSNTKRTKNMLKKTKTRELVKDLLSQSHEPLSASDIYNKLQSENITLSSIYRTLDTFYNHNILLIVTVKLLKFRSAGHKDLSQFRVKMRT